MNAIKAWIIKGFKENDRWMRAHPYKACLDAGFGVFIGTFLGYFDTPLAWKIGVTASVLYLIPSCIAHRLQCKKLAAAAMVLVLGFLTVSNGYSQALLPDLPQAPEAFPPGLIEQVPEGPLHDAAGTQCYVIAIVIVVILAVWVSIHLKRLNDKTPPPPPPEDEGSYEDTDAGSYVQITEERMIDYEVCQALAAASAKTPTTIQLDIEIEETGVGPAAHLKMGKAYHNPTNLVDTEGLKASLEKWGLDLDPNVAGAQYAHNGARVDAWESPISFQQGRHGVIPTISRGGIPYPLIIEQSADLAHWDFLFEARIASGLRLRILDDSTEGQMFYRVRVGL